MTWVLWRLPGKPAYIGRENLEKSAGEALKSAGVVLLITGAGGSFSSVITATGIGNAS